MYVSQCRHNTCNPNKCYILQFVKKMSKYVSMFLKCSQFLHKVITHNSYLHSIMNISNENTSFDIQIFFHTFSFSLSRIHSTKQRRESFKTMPIYKHRAPSKSGAPPFFNCSKHGLGKEVQISVGYIALLFRPFLDFKAVSHAPDCLDILRL